MYLLYNYHSKIRIKHGCIKVNQFGRSFVPYGEKVYSFHSKIPDKPLEYYWGKIIVNDKKDIPKAIEMFSNVYGRPVTLDNNVDLKKFFATVDELLMIPNLEVSE